MKKVKDQFGYSLSKEDLIREAERLGIEKDIIKSLLTFYKLEHLPTILDSYVGKFETKKEFAKEVFGYSLKDQEEFTKNDYHQMMYSYIEEDNHYFEYP